MTKGDGDETIYIGIDESNHGRYPEIVVAVSSIAYSDSVPVQLTKRERMSEEELIRFLKNDKRDYRYRVIKEDDMKSSKNSLLLAIPFLVNSLICSQKNRSGSLEILIDGEVNLNDAQKIRTMCGEVHRFYNSSHIHFEMAKGYPKSKGKYKYPKLLVAADSLAHYIFRDESFRERINSKHKQI